jgi:hypothetical protein
MLEKYTNEQFWKLYKKLPQELQDVLFAEETGTNIYEICEKYKIQKNLGDIVDYVGYVLLGLLPPCNFQDALELELKLEKEIAKKVYREINRFIFYPVKPALEQLYGVNANEPTTEIIRAKHKKTSGEDKYRETIE